MSSGLLKCGVQDWFGPGGRPSIREARKELFFVFVFFSQGATKWLDLTLHPNDVRQIPGQLEIIAPHNMETARGCRVRMKKPGVGAERSERTESSNMGHPLKGGISEPNRHRCPCRLFW